MTEILLTQKSSALIAEMEQGRRAHDAAMKLEATFIEEMLKAAGFAAQQNSFSGGNGEDQFASFHRRVIAEKVTEAGGIGLAEHFLKSMMDQTNDT